MKLSVSLGVVSLLGASAALAQPPSKYPPIKPPPEEPEPDVEPEPVDSEPTPQPSPRPKGAPARKQERSIMEDNTHSMWASLGFGPLVGIVGCVRRLCNTEQAYTQFMITEDFGYHVSGSDGFAIGASLSEAFGADVFRLTPAFKMWWDAPLADDLALYLTPMVSVGYSLLYSDFGALGSLVEHAFNAQAGIGVRMVLVDRALVYVRPVTADVSVGPDGVSLFYGIAVGGGFTFDP